MSKNKEGLIQQEIDKIFAQNNITAHDIGMTNAQLLTNQLIEKIKADFPFKIYKDNDGFGPHPEPVFSFYIKNPADPDKSFEVEDLLEIESKIALWLKKWFGKTSTF